PALPGEHDVHRRGEIGQGLDGPVRRSHRPRRRPELSRADHPLQELARAGEPDYAAADRRGEADDPARGRTPLWDGGGRPSLLAQGPERAIPEDERIALAGASDAHLTDAHVVVARAVHLRDVALKPRGAVVDERNAVGAEMVRHILPPRVDPRRATGEPLRQ